MTRKVCHSEITQIDLKAKSYQKEEDEERKDKLDMMILEDVNNKK